ncbi:MAG: 4-(cytidine 5'-diphospho)-2-C-methyl-D-erythritol kinase [Planctomycetaceae bacterium]|nr:4-(cytidine 5'-diphospho)-2-C-methyl-D-erythritol kinase [Planctomycetaceae bacterium]
MMHQGSLQTGVIDQVVIDAPAKLNFSLAVLNRRHDGFHEIESLMVPVSLYDRLHMQRCPDGEFSLEVIFAGRLAGELSHSLACDVPDDDRNLVLRAARLLAERANVEAGLRIRLEKHIPSGAGLGGGSSDAASALFAASKIWNLDWTKDQLAELSTELGSDIPWFFAGSAGLVHGRGEHVTPIDGIPALDVVIACPSDGLSTAKVYAACEPDVQRRGEAVSLTTYLQENSIRQALPLMHNSLQQPARTLTPSVDALLSDMAKYDALHPVLTGSGSACFSICRTAKEASQLAACLESAGWPYVCPTRCAARQMDKACLE